MDSLFRFTLLSVMLALSPLATADDTRCGILTSSEWTGVDKASFNGVLHKVQLTLTTEKNISWTASNDPPPALIGTFSFYPIDAKAGSTAVGSYTAQKLEVECDPVTGILYFGHYPESQRHMVKSYIGFIDSVSQTLVGFSNSDMDSMPFYAQPGNQLNPEVQELFTVEVLEEKQPKTVETEFDFDFERENALLTEKMQQASQAGDQEEIKKIQQAQIDLGKKNFTLMFAKSQKQAAQNAAKAAAPEQCDDKLIKWTDQLDHFNRLINRYPGTRYPGLMQFSNLFRDRYFTPFFGKPFHSMSVTERGDVIESLNKPCKTLSKFAKSEPFKNINEVFKNDGKQGVVDIVVTAWSLDALERFQHGLKDRVAQQVSHSEIDMFLQRLTPLFNKLWQEPEDSLQYLVKNQHQSVGIKTLFEHINQLSIAVETEGRIAWEQFQSFPQREDVKATDSSTKTALIAHLKQIQQETIDRVYQDAAARFGSLSPGMEALKLTQPWIEKHIASRTFDLTPAQKQVWQTLGTLRMQSYQNARIKLEEMIGEFKTAFDATRFGSDFVAETDWLESKDWQALHAKREQRQQQLQAIEEKSGVGFGPFSDLPGAAYLNALYRSDLKAIYEYDQAFIQPKIELMERVSGDNQYQVMSMLTGGSMTVEDIKARMAKAVKHATMVQPLTAAFLINYEHVYPKCMDANPVVFEKTIEWEKVIRNGFGVEMGRYPAWKETRRFNINQRHADAFQRLSSTNPEKQIMLDTFANAKNGIRLNDVLVGLDKAMEKFGCDSDAVLRLEQNLLTKYFNAINQNDPYVLQQ